MKSNPKTITSQAYYGCKIRLSDLEEGDVVLVRYEYDVRTSEFMPFRITNTTPVINCDGFYVIEGEYILPNGNETLDHFISFVTGVDIDDSNGDLYMTAKLLDDEWFNEQRDCVAHAHHALDQKHEWLEKVACGG